MCSSCPKGTQIGCDVPMGHLHMRPQRIRQSLCWIRANLKGCGLLVLAVRKLFSPSRHSILASKAVLTMTAVLCDGLAASPDCTGSEGVLLPSPHSLGPSPLRVTELLNLTPGD